MVPQLTLYSARICPWAQRATLALAEVNTPHTHVEIDLQNKPDWYASRVNPASKVPVLQVGADNAEGTSFIPESHVVLELVSDLFPGQLLLSDPVLRAEARYFIERFNQVVTGPSHQLQFGTAPLEMTSAALLAGLTEVQSLLQRHPGPFVLGEKLSIGDLGALPFAARLFAYGRAGLLPAEVWKKIQGTEYEVLKEWVEGLVARPSFKATFDEPYVVEFTRKRIEAARAAAK